MRNNSNIEKKYAKNSTLDALYSEPNKNEMMEECLKN